MPPFSVKNFHSKALEHAVTDRDDRGDAQLGGVEVMKIRATALSEQFGNLVETATRNQPQDERPRTASVSQVRN